MKDMKAERITIKKGDRLRCISSKAISLTYGRYYTALCDEDNNWVDVIDDDGIRDSEPISVFELKPNNMPNIKTAEEAAKEYAESINPIGFASWDNVSSFKAGATFGFESRQPEVDDLKATTAAEIERLRALLRMAFDQLYKVGDTPASTFVLKRIDEYFTATPQAQKEDDDK